MLIKVLSLAFDSAYGGFNDEVIFQFLKDKEVVSVNEYFFIKNETPYLILVVKYFPHRAEEASKQALAKKKDNWQFSLTEADMGVFNLLRDWRSERSKKDGLPPYLIFTNQQLADIVKARPQSLKELMSVDGVGPGKAKKFGGDVLEISKLS